MEVKMLFYHRQRCMSVLFLFLLIYRSRSVVSACDMLAGLVLAKYHLFTLRVTKKIFVEPLLDTKQYCKIMQRSGMTGCNGTDRWATDKFGNTTLCLSAVCSVQLTGVTTNIITSDGRRLRWHLSRQMYWTQSYTHQSLYVDFTMNQNWI